MTDHLPPEEPSGSLPAPPGDGHKPGAGASEATAPLAPTVGGAVATQPRSKALTIALLVAAAVLVLGVVGAGAAYFVLRGAPEAVLDKVPSGAGAVVVAHLDPAASQKMNLFRMASKFPDIGTEQELTQNLDGMLDDALSGSGLTHEDLGWVGGEVGGYVTINGAAPSYAVLIASDDDDAAAAMRSARRSGRARTRCSPSPADAYAVLASSGVGRALEDSVTQFAQPDPGPARTIERLGLIGPDGVLQHLTGDLGVEVGPASGLLPMGGTVMVGVDDAGAVQTWLDDHVPSLLAQAGVPGLSSGALKTDDYQGVKITYGALPTTPVAWGVVNGALVVGLSPHAVEQAVDLSQGGGSSITSNADFSSAVDGLPGARTLLYVDVEGILTAVQGILPNDQYQEFLNEGGENLQPIKAIVAGGADTETASTYRVLIEIP